MTQYKFADTNAVRKQKKKAVNNPLTNTQLVCLGLLLFEFAGIWPVSASVRKFMYLQKFGDMVEWNSTWFDSLFAISGFYSNGHPNVGMYYTHKTFEGDRQDQGWGLTEAGRTLAFGARAVLEQRSGCQLGAVKVQTGVFEFEHRSVNHGVLVVE